MDNNNKHMINVIYKNQNTTIRKIKNALLSHIGVTNMVVRHLQASEEDMLHILLNDYTIGIVKHHNAKVFNLYNRDDGKISYGSFVKKTGIVLDMNNFTTTSKYLGRLLRHFDYSKIIEQGDIKYYINKRISGKVIDGITLIHPRIIKNLFGINVKNYDFGKITYCDNKIFIKGHFIVNDKIGHDMVIYNDNIKEGVRLNNFAFLGIEPNTPKFGDLNIDIQSLINFLPLFGPEQIFEWAIEGLIDLENEFVSGNDSIKFNNAHNKGYAGKIEDFYKIKLDENDRKLINNIVINSGSEIKDWVVQEAIESGVKYYHFPGIAKKLWWAKRKHMWKWTGNSEENFNIKFPLKFGWRAYLAPNMQQLDQDGNFDLENNTSYYKNGLLLIAPTQAERILSILGGGDFDDACGNIPLDNNKVVVYRNPNQFGEYVIVKVKNVVKNNKFAKTFTKYSKNVVVNISKEINSNDNIKLKFIEIAEKLRKANKPKNCTITSVNQALVDELYKISRSNASIGVAANAEIIKVAVMYAFNENRLDQFTWNLERIIDSINKTGEDVSSEMKVIDDMYKFIVDNKIPVPRSLWYRVPERYRQQLNIDIPDNVIDAMFEAFIEQVKKVDLNILGSGSVRSGDRKEGWIDTIIPPIDHIKEIIDENIYNIAKGIVYTYNKTVADAIKRLENKEISNDEFGTIVNNAANNVNEFLMNNLDIIAILSLHIIWHVYKMSGKARIHDSIIWNTEVRYYLYELINGRTDFGKFKTLRFWSTNKIDLDTLDNILLVENNKVLIGDKIYNLGDNSHIEDGIYEVIIYKQYIDRTGKFSNNSIVAILK